MDLPSLKAQLEQILDGGRFDLLHTEPLIPGISAQFQALFGDQALILEEISSIELEPDRLFIQSQFHYGSIDSLHTTAYFYIKSGKTVLALASQIATHQNSPHQGSAFWIAFASESAALPELETNALKGLNLYYKTHDGVAARAQLSASGHALQAQLDLPLPFRVGQASLSSIRAQATIALPPEGMPELALRTIEANLTLASVSALLKGRIHSDQQYLEMSADFDGLVLPNITELAKLFGAGKATSLLPSQIKSLPGIALERLHFTTLLSDNTLVQADTRIATTKQWRIHSAVILDKIKVELSAFYPFDPELIRIATSLEARIELGDAALRVQATLPDPSFVGELEPNSRLTLPALASHFSIPATAIPPIAFHELKVKLAVSPLDFQMVAKAESAWEVPVGPIELKIQELELDARYKADDFSAQMAGRFELVGATFSLETSLPECVLECEVENEQALSLNDLTTLLAPSLPPLPNQLATVQLEHARIQLDPTQKHFELSATGAFALRIATTELSLNNAAFSLALDANSSPTQFAINASGTLRFLAAAFSLELSCANALTRWSLQLDENRSLSLANTIATLLPPAPPLPAPLASCKLDKLKIEGALDTAASISFAAASSSVISFGSLGNLACQRFESELTNDASGGSVSINAQGSLTLGPLSLSGALYCSANAANTQLQFNASSTPALTLQRLLKDFIPAALVNKTPAIAIDSFNLELDAATRKYAANATLSGAWPLRISVIELSIQPQSIGFGYHGGSLSGQVAGALSFSGIAASLSISLPDLEISGAFDTPAPIGLEDVLQDLLPPGFALPDFFGGVKLESAQIEASYAASSFSLQADVDATIALGQLGELSVESLSVVLDKTSPNASQLRLKIQSTGTLNLCKRWQIGGQLTVEITSTGAALSFEPADDNALEVAIPYLNNQGNDIELNIELQQMAISLNGSDFRCDASASVSFINFPAKLDALLPGTVTGTIKIENSSVELSVDRILDAAVFALPPIHLPDHSEIDLGQVALDLSDLKLTIGDEVTLSSKFGLGLPSRLNHLFGTRSNGKPKMDFFRSYDPARPSETTMRCRIDIGTAGLSIRVEDSPFTAIEIVSINGENWIQADLGEYGAFRAMMPVFSLDIAEACLRAKGQIIIDRPLQFPLSFVKNYLIANDMGDIAALLPQALAFQTVSLLNSNDEIDAQKLIAHLQSALGSGTRIPVAVHNLITTLAAHFNELPDRLKNYFEISIPDSLAFDIAITSDGGATINIETEGDPIKALIPCGQTPQMLGVEFRGFSFGEILSGSLFLVKLDLTLDCIDLSRIGLLQIPGPHRQYLGNARALQNTITIEKLTTFIVYQTEIPIPLPIFYDKIGYDYVDVCGEEIHNSIHFPQPQFSITELVTLASELLQFASDEDHLLDPNLPLTHSDLKFTIGPTFLKLPKFMQSKILGQVSGNVAEISAYRSIATLLNAAKTFTPEAFIESIPLAARKGDVSTRCFLLDAQLSWLALTRKELSRRTNPATQLPQYARLKALVPQNPSAPKDGYILFLSGSFSAGVLVSGQSQFALVGSDQLQGAFRFSYELANNLFQLVLEGRFSSDASAADQFVSGSFQALLANKPTVTGSIGYGPSGLQFTGKLDLLPTNPAFALKGSVSGILSNRQAALSGAVAFTLGNHFTLSGARIQITPATATVSGTYLGIRTMLEIAKLANGVQLTGSLSDLGAAPIQIKQPTLKLQLPTRGTPKLTLSGQVNTMGISQNIEAQLTPQGYGFAITGKIFNRYEATLNYKTGLNPTRVNDITIVATLGTAFQQVAQGGSSQQLDTLVKGAKQAVKQLEDALKAVSNTLESAIATLKQGQRALLRTLNTQKRAKQRLLTQIQKQIDNYNKAIKDLEAKIRADERSAKRQVDAAQREVNRLKKPIASKTKTINALSRRIAKLKYLHQAVTKAELIFQRAAVQTERTVLITTKTTATQVLNTAKANLSSGASVARQQLAGIRTQLSTDKRTLSTLARTVAAIDSQIANLVNHPSLRLKRQARDRAQAQKNTANTKLQNKKKADKALLQINPANAIRIEKVSFSGKLAQLNSGQISLSVRVSLLGKAARSHRLPFNFTNPAASMTHLIAKLVELATKG